MSKLFILSHLFNAQFPQKCKNASVNTQDTIIPWHDKSIIIYDCSFLKSVYFTTDMLKDLDNTLVMIPRSVRQELFSEVMQNFKKAKLTTKKLEETIKNILENNSVDYTQMQFSERPLKINKAMLILSLAEHCQQCVSDYGIMSPEFSGDSEKDLVILAKLLESAGNKVVIKTCDVNVLKHAVWQNFRGVNFYQYDTETLKQTPILKLSDGDLQITFKKYDDGKNYSIDPRNYDLHVFSTDGIEKSIEEDTKTIPVDIGDILKINDKKYKIVFLKNIPGNIVEIAS